MNSNQFKQGQFDLSGLGCWVVGLATIWLLGSIGFGWLVNSLFVLMGLMILLPLLAFLGLRWWLQFNLIRGQCPACSIDLVGIKRSQLSCPNCGESLQVEGRRFVRTAPPGVVDVTAVEVPTEKVEER